MHVRFSSPAMSAVVYELLVNAKKFHPTGTPSLQCALSRTSSGEICVQLSNDGPNMTPHQLKQVFTPYFQGEKYHTGQLPGMGLGLSMVALLVWQVGGTCKMRNNRDSSGVTVELTFPSSSMDL
jgi:two-component system cell cycle response regulator